jgi:hypothetical protein
MATFRNSCVGRCLGGGSVKNTCVFLSLVAACGLAGCSQPPGPHGATTILLEDEVKVKVDTEGRSSTGVSASAATVETAPKP